MPLRFGLARHGLRAAYNLVPGVRELRAIRAAVDQFCAAALNLERLSILGDERHADPLNLARFESSVFSQGGEDGIIAEIMRRIGVVQRTFVEIGIGDGLQNNTAFLLIQGWRGYWIDADRGGTLKAERSAKAYIDRGKLSILCAHVTPPNVEEKLAEMGVPDEVDLLSVDIDRDTYWVLEAIRRVSPRVIAVEYNASFPPTVSWIVPYDPRRAWDGSINYGASLKAFEEWAARRGYMLVGCTLSGVNAFFVRRDLWKDAFQPPPTSEVHYEPPRYHLLMKPYPVPRFE